MDFRKMSIAVASLTAILLYAGAVRAQDSLNIRRVAEIASWDAAQMVQVQNGYAYVATHGTGLRVMDVHDPAHPVEVGHWAMNYGRRLVDQMHAVAVQDTIAVTANSTLGAMVLSIADPAHPRLLAAADTTWMPWNVAIQGHYAYIANLLSGLEVVDIARPDQPQLLTTLPVVEPTVLLVQDTLAFTAFSDGGIQRVSVISNTDPSNLYELGTYDALDAVEWLVLRGHYLYVGTDGSVEIVDLSDLSHPVLAGIYLRQATDMKLLGSYAVMTIADTGLAVVDLTDPVHPAAVSLTREVTGGRSLWLQDTLAFVTGTFAGLHVLTVADVSAPRTISLYDPPGQFQFGAVNGHMGYFLCADQTVRIYDLSTMPRLTEAGVLRLGGTETLRLAMQDSLLYCAGNPNSVTIYDVSHPASPTEVSNVYFLDGTLSACPNGRYVYAAGWDHLWTVDFADMRHPVVVDSQPAGKGSRQIVLDGSYLIAGGTRGGCTVFDLSDPAHPDSVGGIPQSAYYVTQRDTLVFLGGSEGQMIPCSIFGASNPRNCHLLNSISTDDGNGQVAADNHFFYIADLDHGLTAYRYTDPRSPVAAGYYTARTQPLGLAVDGAYAMVGEIDAIAVYDCSLLPLEMARTAHVPLELSLPEAYPNPFNGTTVLRYELPATGKAELHIHDILGRHVAALVSAVQQAGQHEIRWSADGVASGVYFARLSFGRESRITKLLLVK